MSMTTSTNTKTNTNGSVLPKTVMPRRAALAIGRAIAKQSAKVFTIYDLKHALTHDEKYDGGATDGEIQAALNWRVGQRKLYMTPAGSYTTSKGRATLLSKGSKPAVTKTEKTKPKSKLKTWSRMSPTVEFAISLAVGKALSEFVKNKKVSFTLGEMQKEAGMWYTGSKWPFSDDPIREALANRIKSGQLHFEDQHYTFVHKGKSSVPSASTPTKVKKKEAVTVKGQILAKQTSSLTPPTEPESTTEPKSVLITVLTSMEEMAQAKDYLKLYSVLSSEGQLKLYEAVVAEFSRITAYED